MKIGRREQVRRALRSMRATAGLSQLAVSERLGIPEKRYWRIENGYEEPSETEISKLAKTLKVDEGSLPFQREVRAAS